MNPTMSDVRAWVEVTPDFFNSEEERSKENYIKTVAQFQVLNNPRYSRRDVTGDGIAETFCNIFVWDATKALKCEIPHWVDPATGVEAPMGKGKELSANGVVDWFERHGLGFGWMRCDRLQAVKRAGLGFPTVVLWKNPGRIGHVAIVLPSADPRQVRIAQAGVNNLFDADISKGFGNLGPLLFYTHD